MKASIENYRGFEISFDTERELFYCLSNSYDKDSTSKSYAAIKKWIDDYIKANAEFKPFKVMRFAGSFSSQKELVITGIRKDGKFVYRDGDKTQILSTYSENDYFIPFPENEPILEAIKELHKNIDELHNKRKSLDASLKRVSVRDIKQNYIQS